MQVEAVPGDTEAGSARMSPVLAPPVVPGAVVAGAVFMGAVVAARCL